MQRFLAAVALLFGLLSADTARASAFGSSPPAPSGSQARTQAGVAPSYYNICGEYFGGLKAKCDLQSYTTYVDMSFGSTALTVGTATTYSATVTTKQGGRVLFIAGTRPFGTGDIGKPLDVPGPNGAKWRSRIEGWANANSADQNVFLSSNSPFAETSAAVTLTKDAVLNCATDVGKVFDTVGANPITNSGRDHLTIATCTDSNHATTTSGAPEWIHPGVVVEFRLYTDDSAPMNNAVLAALSRQGDGDRYLYLSTSAGAPNLDEHASRVVFQCERGAEIWKPMPGYSGQLHVFRRHCVYPNAPAADPPKDSSTPTSFTQAATAGPQIIVDWLGASTGTLLQSPIPGGATFYATLMNELNRQNPDAKIVGYNRAIGGQSAATYDGIPGVFATWYSNHSNSWLSYVQADAPDVLVYEISANEGGNFNFAAFFNTHAKLASWTKPPDVVYAMTDEYSLAAGAGTSNNVVSGADIPWLFVRGIAEVYGRPVLDFRSQLVQVRDGVDLRKRIMRHAYAQGATVNTPWAHPTVTNENNDWAINLKYNGTASAFCTAAGGEIQFNLAGYGTGTPTGVARFGCDSAGTMPGSLGAGSTYYQVDVGSAFPGVGAVPLVPTQLDTWTVSGGNTVTASTLTPLLAAHTGAVITIPNAAGSGLPCITVFTYVSSSSGTVSPGCTNGTYTSQALWFGNPRVFTGYNYASDASANFFLNFWAMDTKCGFIVQGRDDYSWQFPCARPGGGTRPRILTSTNITNNNLTIQTEAAGNQYAFYMGTPFYVQPSATDDEILGGAASAADGDYGSGRCGGSGNNHLGCEAAARVILPVVQATNLRIPRRGIQRVTPTTGATVQVSDRTTWVNVASAADIATLTLTMPVHPIPDQPTMLSFLHAVSSALTVNGSAGQSVVGAPSTVAAGTSLAFRYDQTTKAWTRVQ